MLWFGKAANKYNLKDKKEISKKAIQMLSTFMNTHELNHQQTYIKAKEYIKNLAGN